MKTYNLTFGAGETKELIIEHKFFLILSDEGFPVDISIRAGGGYSQMQGLQAGFNLTFPDGEIGRSVLITSDNAQTVKIYMGSAKAEYARLSGSVSLIGSANVNVTNEPIVDVKKFVHRKATHSFKPNLASKAANSVTEIFAPSFNTSGVELLEVTSALTSASGYLNTWLKIHTTTPTAIGDGIDLCTNELISGLTTGHLNISNVFIPSGFGLYIWNVNLLSGDANVCRLSALVNKL